MSKKWLLCICLALIIGLVMIRPKSVQRQISEEIGLDVTNAVVLSKMDTHGGFHGDGTSCVVLQLNDETAQEEIRTQGWAEFPMDETAKTLLYGVTKTTPEGVWTMGPYLCGEDEKTLVPRIESGYYLLLDRHSKTKLNQDPKEILQRASINVTVAVYDDANRILYVCKLDT